MGQAVEKRQYFLVISPRRADAIQKDRPPNYHVIARANGPWQ